MNDKFIQTDFYGQFVQCFTLYDFAAGVGEETFMFAFEVAEDNISYDGIQNGVAQKFQPFVINPTSLLFYR